MQVIHRSYLFVPGSRPERFEKACAAGAGAVIIDLEDAVSPADKAQARAAVASWAQTGRGALLRINGADTEWFRDDLALCSLPGVAGIVLPKAEQAEQLHAVAAAAPGRPLLPLIESAVGMWQAETLARCAGVQRLLFGTIDFQLDAGIDGDGEELHAFRSRLVLVSKVAGLQPPVDGVTVAINDAEKLRLETARARRFGFGAKLCIHPRQVETVNDCFRPTAEEIAWARRILAAADASGGAAVAVDGKMVDLPVIRKAEQIAREARDSLSAS